MISKRMQTMYDKYGVEETHRMLKAAAQKGGKTGGNGLTKLTSKDKSEAGKKGIEALKNKYTPEEYKKLRGEWGIKGLKNRQVDGITRRER